MQFEGQRLIGVELRVVLRVELDGGRAEVRAQHVRGFSVAVGQAGPLAIHDVPVQLGRIFPVQDRGRRRDAAGRELAGVAAERAGHRVDGRLGAVVQEDVGRPGARDAEGRDVDRLVVLIGRGEEQVILPDRPREERAVVLLVDAGGDLDAFRLGADQAVIQIVDEHRAVEAVGAGAQHHVEGAAHEVAVLGVRRHRGHRELLDGVEVDRTTRGGEAALVQAELVLGRHAVHRDAVVARVGAADRHAAAVDAEARGAAEQILGHQDIAPGQVARVAVDADDLLNLQTREHRLGALIAVLHAGGRHHQGFDFLILAGQVDDQVAGLADFEEHAVQHLGRIALAVDRDLVRAADPEAAGGEHAAGLSGRRGLRAGRGVDQFH